MSFNRLDSQLFKALPTRIIWIIDLYVANSLNFAEVVMLDLACATGPCG